MFLYHLSNEFSINHLAVELLFPQWFEKVEKYRYFIIVATIHTLGRFTTAVLEMNVEKIHLKANMKY